MNNSKLWYKIVMQNGRISHRVGGYSAEEDARLPCRRKAGAARGEERYRAKIPEPAMSWWRRARIWPPRDLGRESSLTSRQDGEHVEATEVLSFPSTGGLEAGRQAGSLSGSFFSFHYYAFVPCSFYVDSVAIAALMVLLCQPSVATSLGHHHMLFVLLFDLCCFMLFSFLYCLTEDYPSECRLLNFLRVATTNWVLMAAGEIRGALLRSAWPARCRRRSSGLHILGSI
jgi:hypothetical protein